MRYENTPNARKKTSARLDHVKPSATVAVSQRARELKAAGVDVLSFSVGEPDFEPPKHVLEAAKAAIDAGCSKYTAARGIIELREAVCEESRRRRGGQSHTPAEVVVSVGAKHSLYNLSVALFDPGDEVVIPAPYWVSYPEQVRLAGADPVIVETTSEHGYRMTPDQLGVALSERTRAVVLCTPSNPTGAAYDAEALEGLAEVLRDHDCYVIVDEIYGQLVYGDFVQKSLLEIAPDLRDRLIVVDGVSKTYALTGWRIGWILAPEHVAKACDKVQGQSTTNPAAVAQHAAIAAISGDQTPVQEMRKLFEERRSIVIEGLNGIDGISCGWPDGAFYAFCDVSGLLGRRAPSGVALEDDVAVVTYLLEEARCAVVPGTAFGAPGHFRLSYATAPDHLREGLRRICEAVDKLS